MIIIPPVCGDVQEVGVGWTSGSPRNPRTSHLDLTCSDPQHIDQPHLSVDPCTLQPMTHLPGFDPRTQTL